MGRYTLQRLISTIPVLILVSIVTFTLIRVLPGDVAATRLGENANPENVAELRKIMGLDRPIAIQYLEWSGDLLRGEPGRSLNSDLPVGDQLLRRLPVTVELTIFSLLLSIFIGVPLGVISATKRNTALDHSVRVLAVLGQAIPNFWLAILLLLFLSIQFHWVPPFTYRSIFEAPIYNLKQFILPVIVSGYALSAITMRLTRSSLLEVLGQDYIRTAKSKGLTNLQIMNRHALRNALIPIITIVGTQLGALIGGSIIVEQIFSLPGVGRLTLQAIADRDYTQLQFNVLFLASVVVFTNLLVDLSYGFIDPRIRFSRS
jgi:peptide/nickel transport system permease protein